MSAATAVIDKMVKLGFAERKRSHKDRRVVLIELKKKGRETAKKIMMARKDVLNELFLPLESREKEFYLYIVRKIHGNIREKYENE
jgi:DNA-binding MarR family transcriptional regulator